MDAFAGAECGLPVIPEDGRDGRAPVALDLHIGISRRPSQPLGKTRATLVLPVPLKPIRTIRSTLPTFPSMTDARSSRPTSIVSA